MSNTWTDWSLDFRFTTNCPPDSFSQGRHPFPGEGAVDIHAFFHPAGEPESASGIMGRSEETKQRKEQI
jgi:hypothetical protein